MSLAGNSVTGPVSVLREKLERWLAFRIFGLRYDDSLRVCVYRSILNNSTFVNSYLFYLTIIIKHATLVSIHQERMRVYDRHDTSTAWGK